MSALLYLTQGPTKIVTAGSRQLIQNALDVTEYRHLALLLEVLAFVGTDYEIVVMTGMQLDTEDGWIELGTFGTRTLEDSFPLNLSDALRSIRWEVKGLTGSTPHVTFVISGVGRS